VAAAESVLRIQQLLRQNKELGQEVKSSRWNFKRRISKSVTPEVFSRGLSYVMSCSEFDICGL